MDYCLSDALGSVRQLTDATGTLTYARSYDPYGVVAQASGVSQTTYGYTNEYTSQGLVYLRARHYAPGMGRFLTRDPSGLESNLYLYASANPINRSDPTGLWGGPVDFETFFSNLDLRGPGYMGACFALHSGLKPSEIPDWVTAQRAVDLCKMAFVKEYWHKPTQGTMTLPKTAHELMAWYIHEYGSANLMFNGNEPLTAELATSYRIHKIRKDFYLGALISKKLYQFNENEFLHSSTIDIWNSYYNLSLPISFMLGSFWGQVKMLPGEGRIGFRIDNDTNWESGTHFKGMFRSGGNILNIENVINLNQSLKNQPLSDVMARYPVISILPRMNRRDTMGIYGGGAMTQTFVWTEKFDCDVSKIFSTNLMPVEDLDIGKWNGYWNDTDPIDFLAE